MELKVSSKIFSYELLLQITKSRGMYYMAIRKQKTLSNSKSEFPHSHRSISREQVQITTVNTSFNLGESMEERVYVHFA